MTNRWPEKSNLDTIGVGPFQFANQVPQEIMEQFGIYAPSTPFGQHLRVERVVRFLPGRRLYLASNVDPLWRHRKCWNCGNKYNPNLAQSCSYCNVPLREQRFLASVREPVSDPRAWTRWMNLRLQHGSWISPSAAFLRDGRPVTIYPYNGECLLVDSPAPLQPGSLLLMMQRLAQGLQMLHDSGVWLGDFDASNVLVMPDGSARFSDLPVRGVLQPDALSKLPERPLLRDVRRLCEVISRFADPDDEPLMSFLKQGIDGKHGPPRNIVRVLQQRANDLAVDYEVMSHAGFTDLGLIRSRNEDSWGWRRINDDVMAYVVSDGMGGLDRGDVASRVTVQTMLDTMERGVLSGRNRSESLRNLMKTAVEAANTEVLRHSSDEEQAGATVVGLLINEANQAYLVHVGDSRAYLFRDGALHALTKDHSMVQAMVERGKMTREEARVHPQSNVILSFVGQGQDIDIEVQEVGLKKGDRLLLCSDGLWGEMPDAEIAYHLSQPDSPGAIIQRLVKGAYMAGGKDNIAVIVVDI